MMALSGVRSSWLMLARKRSLARLAFSSSIFFSCSVCFEAFAFGHVAGGGEHALQFSVSVVECRGVVTDTRFLAHFYAGRQLVVGYLAFAQHLADAFFGALRVGEVIFEGRADQLVAGAAGERLHLLVHVGDDAQRVGGHQRVDVRFDQRPGIELLVAQLLFQPLLRGDVAGRGQNAQRLSAGVGKHASVEADRDRRPWRVISTSS